MENTAMNNFSVSRAADVSSMTHRVQLDKEYAARLEKISTLQEELAAEEDKLFFCLGELKRLKAN